MESDQKIRVYVLIEDVSEEEAPPVGVYTTRANAVYAARALVPPVVPLVYREGWRIIEFDLDASADRDAYLKHFAE